jgi:hypothetical protein
MCLVALAVATAACTSDQQGSPTAPSDTTAPTPVAPAPAPTPTITSVAVNGAKPSGSFQLSAMAMRSDSTSSDVTFAAIWISSNPQIATVSSVGFVSVLADGTVDFSATYAGVTGSLHTTVSVPKIYSISGTVTDAASGHVIAGAHVQVLGGPSAVTDANGKYTISSVASGRALIEFSATGYDVEEKDITVDGNETLSVTLTKSQET